MLVPGMAALESTAERINQDFIKKSDTYTKGEIDGKVSSVYKPGGSVTFAGLPAADAAHLGMVYNVTDKFTTTAAFVEGAGKEHPAGTNVVIVCTSAANVKPATYGYDALAGFMDLTGYAKSANVVQKENGKRLMTDAEGSKLQGIATGATKVEASSQLGYLKINGVETQVFEVADDDAVTAMLNRVFGTSG